MINGNLNERMKYVNNNNCGDSIPSLYYLHTCIIERECVVIILIINDVTNAGLYQLIS